jgi:hypothetical protein
MRPRGLQAPATGRGEYRLSGEPSLSGNSYASWLEPLYHEGRVILPEVTGDDLAALGAQPELVVLSENPFVVTNGRLAGR